MKRLGNYWKRYLGAGLAVFGLTAAAWAADAETSATAARLPGGSGTATATARYEGDHGFARTDTRTGQVNVARGVAVGVDEHGVSVSVSTAVAPRNGPAIATNFNMSIGLNGSATSTGRVTATGGVERSVTAGGATATRPAGPVASSVASGRTDPGGVVRAATTSDSTRRGVIPRPVAAKRVIRLARG